MTTGRIARIAVIASVMLATPLHADVLVISSNAPDLKPGMQLADSQQIEVPAGASIRVMLPSGATLQIKGATTRQVKEITKGDAKHDGWWCQEHGVPEHICSLCSDEVASKSKKEGDWCKLHDRAQSQCFKCDPSKYAKFEAMHVAKFGKAPERPPESEFKK